MKRTWKCRCPVNEPVRRLTCSHALTLVSSKGTVAWEAAETYRKRLSCMVLRQELEGAAIVSLSNPLPERPESRHHLACVQPILNLHWSSEICSLHLHEYLTPHPNQLANYSCQSHCLAASSTLYSPQGTHSTTISRPLLSYLERQFQWWETNPNLS